jgi:2-dehydropantoate 2-reductase
MTRLLDDRLLLQDNEETDSIFNTMKNQKTIKIAVAGIGGIGGYLGGRLAHYYSNSENITITFICRGEHYEVIKKNGLEVRSNSGTIHCRPDVVSFNPAEIGQVDVMILCTKSFAVEGILKNYAECITPNTVIITTQNTVNGKDSIAQYLPKGTTILEGIMYISSKVIQPGIIHHGSSFSELLFGTNGLDDAKGRYIAEIFKNAGIDTTFTTNIDSILWKKFIFVSPAAIITAIYHIGYSDILQSQETRELYIHLMSELILLANAKNIAVEEDIIKNNLQFLGNFATGIKSSFQLDLEKNKPNESNSLVQYVINESKSFGLPAKYYEQILQELTKQYQLNSYSR